MIKLYILPIVGDGKTMETAYRPKYTDGLVYSAIDKDGVMLVALDATEEQHIEVSKNEDVVLIEDLNTPPDAKLLEASKLPTKGSIREVLKGFNGGVSFSLGNIQI